MSESARPTAALGATCHPLCGERQTAPLESTGPDTLYRTYEQIFMLYAENVVLGWAFCNTLALGEVELCMRKNGKQVVSVAALNLPQVRQTRGVTLREIADNTKISMRFLLAIEAGDFEQLPGGIYARSYLRQYAREIGIEDTKLLAYYREYAATQS